MTRKLARNYSLSVVAPFVAILILLIAATVLAQTTGAGRTTGKANAVLAPTGASAPAQAQRPSSPRTGAGSSPVSRSQANRHGARPMDENPLFLPPVYYDSGGWSVGTAVADVNGDGKPDLLVANDTSGVAVLLGKGDGTFESRVIYDAGATPKSLAVADVNRDGNLDVVVSDWSFDWCCGSVAVLLGNGDGTFQAPLLYESGAYAAYSVAIADLNGDGKPDVVVANLWTYSGGGWYPGVVGVLLGNGDGTFQPAATYDPGGSPDSIAVSDVNRDGNADLLVAIGTTPPGNCLGNGVVSVLLGNGDGTFQAAATYDAGGGNPMSVMAADVNRDGKPDVLSANYCTNGFSVLLGNGDGTFQTAVTSDSGGPFPYFVAVADVNGDHRPDVAIAHYQWYPVGFVLGNGDGTFQAPVTYDISGEAVTLADVNGDGRPDLLVSTVGYVGVLLNNTGPHSPTTTTLVSSLNPSVFGQLVAFTATVSSPSGTPTGTVVFFDGSTTLGEATLANGTALMSSSSLAAGSHSITAAYQGSLEFSRSTSRPINQVVNMAATTASLASSMNPVPLKEYITYTATVTSQYGGPATGTVTFQDGGSTVATVDLTGSQAAFRTNYTATGTHAIVVVYSGDQNNAGSTSATLIEQVIRGLPSKTVVTTSGTPSFVGQPVTFTATVTSTHGTIPDGELVTFYDGTTAIGTGATASGVATFITSPIAAKTHIIRATYGGDAQFQPSTGKVKQVVLKYPTTTALTSNPNPSNYRQPVTFTATVTPSGPYAPTGKVKFMDGTTRLGAATLTAGVATLTKSTLWHGTHPITAQYLGDASSDKSTSPVVNQVVQ